MTAASELDLVVDVRRQVETHQRVDGLGRRVDDVDEALVRAHLEVLAAVLVLVRRPDDAEHVLLRRQRHGAHHGRAGAGDRVNDLSRRAVDDLVVIRLQADADLLSRHLTFPSLSRRTSVCVVFSSVTPTPEVGRVALAPQPDGARFPAVVDPSRLSRLNPGPGTSRNEPPRRHRRFVTSSRWATSTLSGRRRTPSNLISVPDGWTRGQIGRYTPAGCRGRTSRSVARRSSGSALDTAEDGGAVD